MPANAADYPISSLGSSEAGIVGPQPVPFVFALPASVCSFVFLQSVYTADATAGLRAPFLEILDDTGVSVLTIGQGVQNPSSTLRYHWATGYGYRTGFGIIVLLSVPAGLKLYDGWQISVDSALKGPGDSQVISFQLGVLL